jgi:hypothetical protein
MTGPWTATDALASVGDETHRSALRALLLAIADDEMLMGHRHSEWTGFAPDIESDVALSSIAQEEIGHARLFYEQVAALEKEITEREATERKAQESTEKPPEPPRGIPPARRRALDGLNADLERLTKTEADLRLQITAFERRLETVPEASRGERVTQLKSLVARGAYHVDGELIADAMLQDDGVALALGLRPA